MLLAPEALFSNRKLHTIFYDLRKFLCDRKYEMDCDKDIGDTFDYIKHIKWHFDIKQN